MDSESRIALLEDKLEATTSILRRTQEELLQRNADLAAAGVKVTERDYAGQPHGFFNTTSVSMPARQAIVDAGEIVGRALGALRT